MPKLVISTVGTSLLTNQVNERKDPRNWLLDVTKTANFSTGKITKEYSEVDKIIKELQERAEEKLDNGNVLEIREESAELNGIYGLYEENLSKASNDMHYLLATDTAQGQVTAGIVHKFLRDKKLITEIYTPKGFSTENDEVFSNGIDSLLNWFEEIIPGYKDRGYEIYFNLVGGFKAIQGFANTIGMFYADKIIYVFEGSRKIITIPRLPIAINHSVIKPVEFALMAAEHSISINISELGKVPESLLYICDNEATLSNWGKLTWNNCKYSLFTKDLIQFPAIGYDKSFQKDYQRSTAKDKNKYELHTALAEISATILKFNGDTSRILPKFEYRRYEGGQKCDGGLRKNEIDHFYLNKDEGWRVSCVPAEINDPERGKIKGLRMRHFGEHDYVNDNP